MPVILAGIVALLVMVYLIAKGSGQKTITPAVPPSGGSAGGATTTDISSLLQSNNQSILDAISSVQSQIASLPAGTTNDQLNAALANLQSAMSAANNTTSAQTVSTLQTALASVQSALGTQNDQNTQALQQSISALQGAITQSITQGFQQELAAISGGFSGQDTFLQQQFNSLQTEFNTIMSYLPHISLTNDLGSSFAHYFNYALQGTSFFSYVNPGGITSGFVNNQWNLAMEQWISALRSTVPALSNVPQSSLQNMFYYAYVQHPTIGNDPTQLTAYLQSQVKGLTNYVNVTA